MKVFVRRLWMNPYPVFRGGVALLVASALFSLSGCAKPLHYWGSYEDSLYASYCRHDPDKAFELMSKTVTYAERKNLSLAPGIYAEYGTMLYQRGNPGSAVVYFQKEAEAYPESATLMNTLIVRLKSRPPPAKDLPSSSGPPSETNKDVSGGER